MNPLPLFMTLLRRVRRSLELSKYSPATRAIYLRQLGAQVGEGCVIIPTSVGTEPYLVKIGNNVGIAANVEFLTHDGGCNAFRRQIADLQVFGPIVIEDNVVIGQGAVLFPNIHIGKNSIVSARSVVITDVPPNTIVMGIPARPFGSVDKYREKCIARWQEQRPPDAFVEPHATWWSSRHFDDNRRKLRLRLLELFSAELRGTPEPERAQQVGDNVQ
jgi:acetyltransferase-like isoleucine patch superfamily enzyme